MGLPLGKVGHLQPFYLFLSRLGCSLGELQDVWADKFCQAKHPEDQNPASIYGQDMELLMTESHMLLQDIKSSPSLTGHIVNRSMPSIRLNLLTKTTWKLKTPGGILVFRVLVQVCLRAARSSLDFPQNIWKLSLRLVSFVFCLTYMVQLWLSYKHCQHL